ncbi:major facilitator superfamily domain-containing protein [Aspergillus oleicola]
MPSSTGIQPASDTSEDQKHEVELVEAKENASSVPTIDEASHQDAFSWNYDVISSLVALNSLYFAASWGLIAPTAVIGFIVQAYPESSNISAWISASVTIPNCVLQAFIGDLSDILDRRWFLLVGALFGITGCLVSSRATSMEMVIGGQVLNGVGLTLDFLAIPLSAEVVPKKNRPIVSAISIIVSGFATVLGPLIEGAFIKHDVGGANNGWRAGFYFGAGFYAVAFILTAWLYHPQERPNPQTISKLARVLHIDWFGIFLVTVGLVLLLVALNYGGNTDPWDSAKVLATMILGIVCLFGFVAWSWKGTSEGIVRHDLFEHRNFPITLLSVFTAGMVFFGGQAYIPQEVLYLFTSDPVMTSIWSYPYNIATILGAACSGVYMAWSKEAKGLMVGSFALLTLGSGLMTIVKPDINFAGWFFPTAIMGFAVGVQIATSIVLVSLCTPDRFIALSVSLCGAVRGLGGSIGVTIFNSIYSSKISNFLPEKVAGVLIESGFSQATVAQIVPKILAAVEGGSAEAILQIPGMTLEIATEVEHGVQVAFADAFRYIWYAIIPFAAISIGFSWFLKSTKEQMTNVVAAGVKRRH